MGALGRRCLKCQPSSRTGQNPPYGMIGGTVETAASFEARYAPLSYPTAGGDQRWSSLPRHHFEIIDPTWICPGCALRVFSITTMESYKWMAPISVLPRVVVRR